jgi:DNA-binding HxlR family transcriptional regulator
MTKSDPIILELLEESNLDLPPSVISHNIEGISYSSVKRRLPELQQHNLVEKVSEKRGYYRITERGSSYLAGEIRTEELETDDG